LIGVKLVLILIIKRLCSTFTTTKDVRDGMNIPKNPRITINKTSGEWDCIKSKIKELNQKNTIHSYMNNEVNKLTKRFLADPNEITFIGGEKIEIQFPLQAYTCIILKELSEKMQKPVNSIIDDFIITPLLAPKL
jgi:hypothetical protein